MEIKKNKLRYDHLHILDKKISFVKENNKNLIDLKIFILFNQRYGLGYKIINKICLYCGIKKKIIIKDYKYNLINKNLNVFFKFYQNKMDIMLKMMMMNAIKKNIFLYNYKGSRYKNNLPLHGQRRRSNNKTSRKNKIVKIRSN